jgi:tetratricopeptide (TPR) repeat protein
MIPSRYRSTRQNIFFDLTFSSCAASSKKIVTPSYTEIVNCLSVIAHILSQKLVYSRAIEYLKRCLRMSEASHHQGHSSIVQILMNLGMLQIVCRQYELSLAYELKCFSIREEVLPPDHQDIGNSLSNIGTCYEELNQIKTALEYHKRALGIYEQCLPFEHVDRKNVQLKIAQLCKKVEQINI